mmetsp:Transcript_11430/g.21940  ORF Transcript_11430/g.21940 Transcript_11430/m.21940 type:complete len:91 (+) Transcript_11430:79-351(+)
MHRHAQMHARRRVQLLHCVCHGNSMVCFIFFKKKTIVFSLFFIFLCKMDSSLSPPFYECARMLSAMAAFIANCTCAHFGTHSYHRQHPFP